MPEKLKKLDTPEKKEKLLENEYTLAHVYLLKISGRTDQLKNLGVDKYTWEIMLKHQKLMELRKTGKVTEGQFKPDDKNLEGTIEERYSIGKSKYIWR